MSVSWRTLALRQALHQALHPVRRAPHRALLAEQKEAQGGERLSPGSRSDPVASQDADLGLGGPRAHRPNHGSLPPAAASPWAGRLTIKCPLHWPDSLHPLGPRAGPPEAVGRSPAAPSPVGSVPRACGLFPRPSSPTGLCSAPSSLPAAVEEEEEARRGLAWGRSQPPPPVGRVGG